jgi:hypothetical protein
MNLINGMPKQINFNEIHKSTVGVDPVMDDIKKEIEGIAVDLEMRLNDVDESMPSVNRDIKSKTESLKKDQQKLKA